MDDATTIQLPDDPALLKRMILDRDALLARREEAILQRDTLIAQRDQALVERDTLLAQRDEAIRTLQEDNQLLQHRLRQLLRCSYGPRAERFDPRQLLLFGLIVPPIEPVQAPSAEPSEDPPRKPRKSHGRRKLPDHLPRVRIEHDLDEDQKPCPCCGGKRHKIGEELTEQLEHVPANFIVLQHARLKYACPHCNDGHCTKCDGHAHIDIADKPAQPVERGLAGPGLLAWVATSKLADHLPLYRIQGILARQQIDIARSTLCGWMKAAAEVVQPLYELMCQRVRGSPLLWTDDTTVPVMDEDHCRTGRLWTYIGDESNPHIVYHYTPTRAGDGPMGWLGTWKGYLHADAYAGYDRLYQGGGVIEVACWAHTRRHFFDAQESDGPRAAWMLGMIRRLYAVEKQAQGLAPERRRELRQSQSVPVLGQIHLWLQAQLPQVLPRSPIAQALHYALNQWPALCIYTSDGRLSIDNNVSERALRRVAVGRKNWLWAGTDESAQSHAVLWSLIASAQRHEIDVQLYLRSVLAHLPGSPTSELELYLPDVWKRDLMAEHAAQLQNHHARLLAAPTVAIPR